MNVPFLDLNAQYHSIKHEIDEAIQDVIADKAFIRGRYVEAFEEAFARYCGAQYCHGVANGTDALFIALKVFDIGPSDEVIVPANSFIATSEAVALTGAKAVFSDCHPETYCIDPTKIESKITNNTRAIIPVHLYGHPADLSEIRAIADRYQLKLIQDCAQAHGAAIGNRSLSDYGDVLCFSFYPGKNLGAYGDAGAVVTNDPLIHKKVSMFANHGRETKYNHKIEGCNSRMDGLQGAILNVKLKYLTTWINQRIAHAKKYSELLQGVPDIVTTHTAPTFKHVFHLYVIRSNERDKLKQHLMNNQIETGIHYPIALPELAAYGHLRCDRRDYPLAFKYQNQILSLPIYPELSDIQIERVVDAISSFYR